ncbi:hypothetical protein PROFUN_10386 [Planoprotostelium fungivorum]|uniref:Uncharacterized protein n=1 Tax=Planoprotostelium fungivorum TaxID=1890364 RepID=A0A2P6NEC7_9EUKA|nr:hypothetical protein PROFUN_10386 [Planoprotostelium fungivorum]
MLTEIEADISAWMDPRPGQTMTKPPEDEAPFFPSIFTSYRSVAGNRGRAEVLAKQTAAQRLALLQLQEERGEIWDFLDLEDNIDIPINRISKELRCYLEKSTMSKILDKKEDEIADKIRLDIKDDLRFNRNENASIREELYKRAHKHKYAIYKVMERDLEELNRKAILDPKMNHARIRSQFKVKLQQLAASIPQIHAEIIAEMEKRMGMDPKDIEVQYPHKKQWEHNQAFLEKLRSNSMPILPRGLPPIQSSCRGSREGEMLEVMSMTVGSKADRQLRRASTMYFQ